MERSFKKEVQAAGLKVVSSRSSSSFFTALGGQVFPTRPGYDAKVPWVDANDPARALKVRKALNLAVNKQEILDHILMGEGELTAVPLFIPGEDTYDPAWKQYPYDPEQAKKLLVEAGYPNGFNITMMLFPSTGRPEVPAVGQAVAMFWEKIGIKVKLVNTDFASFKSQSDKRNTPGMSWAFATPLKAEPIATTLTFISTSSSLLSGVEDKRIDDIFYRAMAEPDPAKRAKITRELGQLFYDNYWTIPIATTNTLYAVSKKVGEWPLPPNTQYPVNLEGITHGR